ncbi:class II aldolase/adducin family protein [Kitasatospora sp. NPDC086801]|uniref:class II aldolase/adducin family protein n=1 Tax=Kitasatospora sp. NPDC086801 TaxID=3364066 RepID=UPI0037F1BA23
MTATPPEPAATAAHRGAGHVRDAPHGATRPLSPRGSDVSVRGIAQALERCPTTSAVLLANHGPLVFGPDAADAANLLTAIEESAEAEIAAAAARSTGWARSYKCATPMRGPADGPCWTSVRTPDQRTRTGSRRVPVRLSAGRRSGRRDRRAARCCSSGGSRSGSCHRGIRVRLCCRARAPTHPRTGTHEDPSYSRRRPCRRHPAGRRHGYG